MVQLFEHEVRGNLEGVKKVCVYRGEHKRSYNGKTLELLPCYLEQGLDAWQGGGGLTLVLETCCLLSS